MTAAELLRMAGGFKRAAYQQAADLTSYSIIDGDSRGSRASRKVPIGRCLGR